MSTPGISSQADLFSMPITDTTVSHSAYETYKPLNNTNDSNSKLEFRIVGNSEQYIDLSDSFLHLQLQVVNHDGDLVTDQDISLANNVLHSLFSDIQLFSNSKLVSSCNNCYPYKSYIEKVLSYGNGYFNGQGMCPGFIPDTTNFIVDASNEGYKKRTAMIADSKRFELIDRLHLSLCSQPRFLLNDMDLTLALTRSSDAFVIMGKNYKRGTDQKTIAARVKILDATFYVRKQTLYPSIILAHQKLLECGKRALYPVSEGNVKFFTIPSGNQSFIVENAFPSIVPTRIVLGFVTNAAFNGAYLKNPFKFALCDVNYMNITVNNISAPMPPLNIETSVKSLMPYWMVFSSLGIIGQNQGCIIDRDNFSEGYGLFTFDLQKCSSTDDSLVLERTGNVRFDIKFSKALIEAVNLIVYYEVPRTYEIDQYRQMT